MLKIAYQEKRLELLKERSASMKKLHALREESVSVQIAHQQLAKELIKSEVAASHARLEVEKQNFQRTKALYDRDVLTDGELQAAQLKLTNAEVQHRQAQIESEQHHQKLNALKIEFARNKLEGAIQIQELELEVLEADFEVKDFKLQLESVGK